LIAVPFILADDFQQPFLSLSLSLSLTLNPAVTYIITGTVTTNDPAFWPESVSPFYSLPTGRRSCYNDLGYCMLRSLVPFNDKDNSKGGYVKDSYISSMSEMFSPTSEYAAALKTRKEAYDPNRRLEDRQPVPGPWQQGAVSAFMESINKGESISGNPESLETDGLCTTIPLIARLAAEEGLGLGLQSESLITVAASLLSSNNLALAHTLAASRVIR
jgi:hypothetical protein